MGADRLTPAYGDAIIGMVPSTCSARSVPPVQVGAAIIMPAVNTEAMNVHLKEISIQVAPGAHAAADLRWRWLASARQEAESARQHHPDPVAAYSPKLNPMENIWDYLRGNKLSSLVWDSYDAILNACKNAWIF